MITATWTLDDLPVHLATRIKIHPVSGCWVWDGPVDKGGYGKLNGRNTHRLIWEYLVGPVPAFPKRLVLDHREDWGCLTKACGWPVHLLPVTNRVNCTRPGAGGAAAVNIRKDRCGTCGTPYDLLNTYFKPDGGRNCRNCNRVAVAAYKARERAKLITVTLAVAAAAERAA